jgi:hypothetical protein
MARHRLRTRAPDAERVVINISLPVDVFDQVKERAIETERSMSNMVTVLLRRGLEGGDE